jgi:hypothetical protein
MDDREFKDLVIGTLKQLITGRTTWKIVSSSSGRRPGQTLKS